MIVGSLRWTLLRMASTCTQDDQSKKKTSFSSFSPYKVFASRDDSDALEIVDNLRENWVSLDAEGQGKAKEAGTIQRARGSFLPAFLGLYFSCGLSCFADVLALSLTISC